MSTKSYKRGVTDTAHAFAEFERKQSDAINFVRENFVEGIQQNINDLCEHITEQEKNALYKFSAPLDIRDLDDHDKALIVGILYVLANDKYPTEHQKHYIQHLQKYIDVKEYPLGIDISVIEDIDSITTQKMIFQVVIEYLTLQNSDAYDETDIQNVLLNSFNISTNAKNEIIERVEFVYKILGNDGVSKKYDIIDVNADKKVLLLNEKEKVLTAIKELELRDLPSCLGAKTYTSDVIGEEFSTKSRCLDVAKAEVKKIYNGAIDTFNPNSNKSIAVDAFDTIMCILNSSLENIRHSVSMFPADIFESKTIIDELLEIVDIETFKKNLKAILKEELLQQRTYDTFASLSSYISKIELISDSDGGIMGALTAKWSCIALPEWEIYEEADRLVKLYATSVSGDINKMLTNMTHKIEEALNKIQID